MKKRLLSIGIITLFIMTTIAGATQTIVEKQQPAEETNAANSQGSIPLPALLIVKTFVDFEGSTSSSCNCWIEIDDVLRGRTFSLLPIGASVGFFVVLSGVHKIYAKDMLLDPFLDGYPDDSDENGEIYIEPLSVQTVEICVGSW